MADASDPFDTLKHYDAHDAGAPLSPAEVRARGDRMRRRRTAFRAVAAAAAVAVVTTGGVALGGDLTTGPAPLPPTTQSPEPKPSTPSPSAEPSHATEEPFAWTTEIPDGFPLAAGWPDVSGSRDDTLTGPGRGLDPLVLDACGRAVPEPGSTDRINAVLSNVANATTRELRVFPSDQEAVTYLAHLRNLWQECDPAEDQSGLLRVVRPTAHGEESFALVTGTQLDQNTAVTLGVVQVVRIGNAVFADEIGTEGGQPDMEDELSAVLAGMAEDSAPVVEAMRGFAGEPSGGDPPQAFTWVTEIPREFPLALGYPEDRYEETELTGPGEDVPAFTGLEVCGRLYETVADQTDRLAVTFTQPEDWRARELTLTASDEAATGNYLRLAELFRSCPREELGHGSISFTEVRDVAVGDDGFVAIRTSEQDGLPGVHLELTYGVRVGNAVLLYSTADEGGGNEKLIYAQVREQTQTVAELTEAMCVFSGDGCDPISSGTSNAP